MPKVFPQAIAKHIGNGMATRTNGKRKLMHSFLHRIREFVYQKHFIQVLFLVAREKPLCSEVEGRVEISHNAYRSFNLRNPEKDLTIIFNFLVSKGAFLSRFMETILPYIWNVGFFLILDHRKEWSIEMSLLRSRHVVLT